MFLILRVSKVNTQKKWSNSKRWQIEGRDKEEESLLCLNPMLLCHVNPFVCPFRRDTISKDRDWYPKNILPSATEGMGGKFWIFLGF